MRGIRQRLLDRIRDFFIDSGDYNGISVDRLATESRATHTLSVGQLAGHIHALAQQGKITLQFANYSGNAHIKRLPDLPIAEQLGRFASYRTGAAADVVCLYPSAAIILPVLDETQYTGRPFSRRLALAEAQLAPVFFDLAVLDPYFRDPRYHVDFQDYSGRISVAPEHDDGPTMREDDRLLLDSFGIGYDGDRTRIVVAYLRYLARLTPKHQQIWYAHGHNGACSMNGDYARATIDGAWPIHRSAYLALRVEEAEINKLCALIGKPPLFRETFADAAPHHFAPMLRPTSRNFDDFVHLLDKMLSENIDRQFFDGDIPLETQRATAGGVTVERKGTLTLLQEWLDTTFTAASGTTVGAEVTGPLKEVRQLRRKPAHAINEDAYDPGYPNRQDDLVGRVTRTLTKLRLILMSHPSVRGRYTPPDWLDGDRIVFY